jgi:hypothetical protein
MEYASVQTLINNTIDDLGYAVMFGHGRDADFNQLKEKKYPLVWLDPMEVTTKNPTSFDNTERWAISMVFLVKALADDVSSTQNSLVDFSESMARDFIAKLNDNDNVDFANNPNIKPLHRTTFGTDHTSGCILTLSLIVYDTYVC